MKINRYTREEPPPIEVAGSQVVLEQLRQDLLSGVLPGKPEVHLALLSACEDRSDMGLAKYGTRLKVPNGRDYLTDLVQELADAAVYARGAYTEGLITRLTYYLVLFIAGLVIHRYPESEHTHVETERDTSLRGFELTRLSAVVHLSEPELDAQADAPVPED